jgi:predicted aconitase
LGQELTDEVKDYLKDFGAATASNGAVGLYHIENLTPEAKELGKKLVKSTAKVYVIDDEELERIYKSYPVLWKNKSAKPKLCFIGCPHLSLNKLNSWTERITTRLAENGRKKVKLRTIMTTSPQVLEVFKNTENYNKLVATGVKISSICPLMYTNNPVASMKPIITSSNKLRTYSKSKYLKDEDILKEIAGGSKND